MSQKKTVLVITAEEGRNWLVHWYADFITGDRNNLLDMLRTGSMRDLPNFSQMEEKEVAEMLTNLPVGNNIANSNGVEIVLLQLDNTFLKVGEMDLVPLADVPSEPTISEAPTFEVSF